MTSDRTQREWDAGVYHRASAPQRAWGERVLGRLALRGDERVMDAGCGTGRVTAQLLDRLARGTVVGVDASRNMLATARRHLVETYGPRVALVAADLRTLPFATVFDGVFSTATFHWIAEHDVLFAEIAHVLRPRGWLVAQCGGRGNLARFEAIVADVASRAPFAEALASYRAPWFFADVDGTRARLEAAGFVDVDVSLEDAPTPFADRAQYVEFVTSVVLRDHLARLASPALRSAFVDAIADRAAPHFDLDYVRLNLRATRG